MIAATVPAQSMACWEADVARKVAEILKMIEVDGWYLVVRRGSHRQYKHATKCGRVTVAGKPSDTLHPRTERSILGQAGLERRTP